MKNVANNIERLKFKDAMTHWPEDVLCYTCNKSNVCGFCKHGSKITKYG